MGYGRVTVPVCFNLRCDCRAIEICFSLLVSADSYSL
jgi:hypothetical protein